MTDRKRMMDVDIVKAIGIILMVMGHIEFGTSFDFYIHSFHIPLFFIMSGFLYRDKEGLSFLGYTKGRARVLLVPYIVVGLLHFTIKIPYIFITKGSVTEPLWHLFYDNSDKLPIAGALWFLTAVFFSYILMFLVRKISNLWIECAISAIISIIGYYVSYLVILPWSIGPALTCFGFMYFGWLLCNRFQIVPDNIGVGFICILIGLFVATFNGYVNVRISQYGNFLLFYSSAILITIGLQALCRKICVGKSVMINEFQFIGKNSLIYMCFNQVIVWLPNKLLNRFSGFSLYFFKCLELVITIIILHFVAMVLTNSTIWAKITGRK